MMMMMTTMAIELRFAFFLFVSGLPCYIYFNDKPQLSVSDYQRFYSRYEHQFIV